jgi:hypothetical protein
MYVFYRDQGSDFSFNKFKYAVSIQTKAADICLRDLKGSLFYFFRLYIIMDSPFVM